MLLWMTERDPQQRPGDMRVARARLKEVLLSLRRRNRWVNWLKSIALVLPKIVMEGDGNKVPRAVGY
jgi:hypothetical protein